MHSLQQRLFGFALIGTLLLSTVTAWGQTQAPPQTKQTRGGRLFGTIASISDGSLVLTTRRGQSVTVHMSSTTRILGHKEATLADIQSGDLVRVTATKAGDGSLSARSVEASPASTSMSSGRRGGVWQSESGTVMIGGSVAAAPASGTLTIAVPSGQPVSVAVPSSARISRLIAVPASSLSSGARVFVQGTPNADGSVTAAAVYVASAKAQ